MLSFHKTSPILALALLATGACSDKGEEAKEQTQASPNEVTETASASDEMNAVDASELLEEAVAALQETQTALAAIDEEDDKKALEALERATGKLEILLARSPNLALAPVDVSVVTHDILADEDAVKALKKQVEDKIEDGRLQEARRLMDGLASETIIRVSNLPLATYPDAIKSAAALLAKDKPQEAKEVILAALGTIVVQDTIIPLPIARAQGAINEARELAKKSSRTKADNDRITGLLEKAREQLRFARALGYAKKDDIKDLLDSVDEIEDETKNDQSGSRFFDKIEKLFERAKKASQPDSAGNNG